VTSASPYAARPWLRHYDYWVRPHMTYPQRPLTDILTATAIEIPDKPATTFFGAQLTFREIKRRSDLFAAKLVELGIVQGDRVGIMLPNCPQYIIAAFGVLRLGAIVVNINPSYTAREARTVVSDSGVKVALTLDALEPLVKSVGVPHVLVTSLGDDFLGQTGAPLLPLVKIDPQDVAVLQYTGGTTGTPKGAMLTHANIFANVVQTETWTNRAFVRGEGRYIVVLPYFHIYAFTVCMMMGIWTGALQVIFPKYDPDQMLAAIREFRPTYVPAVPTLFVSLLNHPKVGEYALDLVRTFNSGGAPCPPEVIEEWERRIGRPLNEGYGLSETSPVTHSTPQLARRKPGTIGLPVPDTDITVVDIETGTRELPLGDAGELCIAGPQVMKGYWNRPDETARALRTHDDGRVWFHTGDIARVDEDGFTTIVQRKKDLIIVDGYNVYPSDVEGVLYTHPAVKLAAVIGVPDPYHGEIVKACIAFRPQMTASTEELLAHCRANLAEYKIPRLIEIRDTLPMSAVGKILYRVLRDEHAAAAAAATAHQS
jgi:long-chain acyl-CoA synthetase